MRQPDVYRNLCAALKPSAHSVEEVLHMTKQETNRRRSGRRTLAALAACACLCLSVAGVNAATDGAIAQWIITNLSPTGDPYHLTGQMPGGGETDVYLQWAWVENRDGRAILVTPGEEIDITQALAEEGTYVYQGEMDGAALRAEVTGTAEDWTIQAQVDGGQGEKTYYTFRADEGDAVANAG